MRLKYLFSSLIVFCFVLFPLSALADYYRMHFSPNRSNPHNYPPVQKRPYIEAQCKECEGLAEQYNSVVDKLYKAEEVYRELDIETYEDQEMINHDLDHIYALQASGKKDVSGALETAEKVYNNDVNDYERHLSEYDKQRTVVIAKLKYELFALDKQFKKCEAACVKHSVSKQTTETSHAFVTGTNIGVVGGNLSSSRNASVDSELGKDSSSQSKNKGLVGVQAVVSFDPPGVRPFLLFNALTTTNSATTFNGTGSNMTLNENWLMHVMGGVQSMPFSHHISVGAGAGAGIVNQKLKGSVVVGGTTNTASTSNTSVEPALMADVLWEGCDACVFGHAGTISLQLMADRFPSLNAGGTTPFATPYNFNVNSKWQLSEMLVFGMRI